MIKSLKNITTLSNTDHLNVDAILYQLQRNGHYKDQNMLWTPSKKFMIDLFKDLRREESLQNSSGQLRKSKIRPSDTVRSYSAKVPQLKYNKHGCPKLIYVFDIPKLPIHEQTNTVEFRVFYPSSTTTSALPRLSCRPNNRYRHWTVVVKQNGIRLHKSTQRYRLVRDNVYEVFNITKAVNFWINSKHGNISIVVRERLRGEKDDLRDNDDDISMAQQKHNVRPGEGLLVLYSGNSHFFQDIYQRFTAESQQVSRQRQRRHSSQSKSKRRRQKRKRKKKVKQEVLNKDLPCGLYDYYIDFNVIGWGEWIVFPKRFNAHLCSGNCPSPITMDLNPTNHAMLRSLMKLKQPDVTPLPCCVPTKLKPISLLYLEPEEIVLRQHADVVAEECGCR
ncbi:nodal homolog [Octopus bimaculoides]|nr:nodal homolog [Octopus bimaculoides]